MTISNNYQGQFTSFSGSYQGQSRQISSERSYQGQSRQISSGRSYQGQSRRISSRESYQRQSRHTCFRQSRPACSSVSFGRQNISNIYVRHRNSDVCHIFSPGVRPVVGSFRGDSMRGGARRHSSITTYIRRHPASNTNATPVFIENTDVTALTLNRNFKDKIFYAVKLPFRLLTKLKSSVGKYIFKNSDREKIRDSQIELQQK